MTESQVRQMLATRTVRIVDEGGVREPERGDTMHIKTIFRADIQGGAKGEGLTVAVVGGERLAVCIELERRRRVVYLDREGALKMAEAIRAALLDMRSGRPESEHSDPHAEPLLSARDVAVILGVPLPSLYGWMRENPARYGAVRVGPRAVRFRRSAIDKLIEGA